MDELPTELLLEVMQHLDEYDLFACRLVCKRLKDLALHPALWRVREIYHHIDRHADNIMPLRVLRLAPCLRRLYLLSIPSIDTHMCGVYELEMSYIPPEEATLAAGLIVKQQFLDSLRSLKVDTTSLLGESAAALWALISSTADLEELTLLDITSSDDSTGPTVPLAARASRRVASVPSLKKLKCIFTRAFSEHFCNAILAAHAATLEEVDVNVHYESKSLSVSSNMTSVADLLAGMPKLRRLECSLLPGLEAVAACESLTHVCLTIGPYSQRGVQAVTEFLRCARHLRDVELQYYEDKDHITGDLDLDLVSVLASGPSRSTVESLNVSWDSTLTLLPRLLSALPRLPALEHLEVSDVAGVTDELLLGITPGRTPALRCLRLSQYDTKCVHAWLHRESVQALLLANPSLKLWLSYIRENYCPDNKLCNTCQLGCHQDLRVMVLETHKRVFVMDHMWEEDYVRWTSVPRSVPK